MNTMNKAIKFFAMGAMLFSTTLIQVNAQDAPAKPAPQKEFKQKTPEERANQFVEKMSGELNLNDKQKKELYTLKLNEIKQRQAQHQQNAEARKKSVEDFKKLLTPEQVKTLEAKMAERKEAYKEHHGKKGPHKANCHPEGTKPAPAPAK